MLKNIDKYILDKEGNMDNESARVDENKSSAPKSEKNADASKEAKPKGTIQSAF